MLVIPHEFILWKFSISCRFEVCICFFFFFFLVKRRTDQLFPMQWTHLLYTVFLSFLDFKSMKTGASRNAMFVAQLISCRGLCLLAHDSGQVPVEGTPGLGVQGTGWACPGALLWCILIFGEQDENLL